MFLLGPLSVCKLVNPHACMVVWLYVCLFVYLNVCLGVSLFDYVFACLSVGFARRYVSL